MLLSIRLDCYDNFDFWVFFGVYSMFYQNGTSSKYCWRFRNKSKEFCKYREVWWYLQNSFYFVLYGRAVIDIYDLLII